MVLAKGRVLVKSTTLVLHNHTLTWRELSPARNILMVKSAWAFCMLNNILIVLAHVQLNFFYCISSLDITEIKKMYQALSRLIIVYVSDGKLGEGLGKKLVKC